VYVCEPDRVAPRKKVLRLLNIGTSVTAAEQHAEAAP
jgi:hypothetical protein